MSRLLQIFAILLVVLLLSGCGKNDEKAEEKSADKSTVENSKVDLPVNIGEINFEWVVRKGREVIFYYQPDTSLTPKAEKLGLKFVEIYLYINNNLNVRKPKAVEFYCFKDIETLEKYTSQKEPFWLGNKFYYGYGPAMGPHISVYATQNLPQGTSKFAFIQDGLISLFDYSGRNYHHTSNVEREKGELTSIIEIGNNKRYNELNKVKKVVEAASICGFLLYEYGSEKFMQIYTSEKNITDTFQEVLGVSIDEVEKGWREFLPTQSNERLKEAEDSLSRE